MKHNKKRNTAVLFEVLVKELTKSIISSDEGSRKRTLDMLKEHFGKSSILSKELELYRTLNETVNVGRNIAEKLLLETKVIHSCLSEKKIFVEQSKLVSKINKLASKDSKGVFSNFVPDYKSLASISQIFNVQLPVKKRILLEQEIIEKMVSPEELQESKLVPIDNLTYKTFVEKFNTKYDSSLVQEQKVLLNKFMTSFADNGLELKIFLNEEIERLSGVLTESLKMREVKQDSSMKDSVKKVLNILKEFKEKQIDATSIKAILKIQDLAEEIKK